MIIFKEICNKMKTKEITKWGVGSGHIQQYSKYTSFAQLYVILYYRENYNLRFGFRNMFYVTVVIKHETKLIALVFAT